MISRNTPWFVGLVGAVAVALFAAAMPRSAQAATIADSVADFSGTQGQNNWQYGYYTSPFTPSTFALMSNFDGTFMEWRVDPLNFYTMLDATGGHPNGTGGALQQTEQWAVRRWTSPTTGTYLLSGAIADLNPANGNGVIVRIFQDGTEFYNHTVSNGATSDFAYLQTVFVTAGSHFDFAIAPNGNDNSDITKFTAIFSSTPEPGITSLLLFSLACLFARRKRAGI